ncbi:hypothetical protein Godav_015609 [Gossypium davidsonii]|uniref:Uncharacterized protein n=1 Tax=Gossypium davidsonii TaxID=34287 RepID=A0A7J8RPL0_GOSDV|nr:hypothetical protein [Gossypium davidsonii]
MQLQLELSVDGSEIGWRWASHDTHSRSRLMIRLK